MTERRIALVTGANKGIGFAVARRLGEQGAVVLLGARDETRGKEAAAELTARGLTVLPLRLDVTDDASLADAAQQIEQRYRRLDVLVNNAATTGGFTGPPSEATAEAMREVYETNVFGVVATTSAMLPLLRRSPAGRVVNLSSDAGSLTLNADPDSPFRHYNMITYQSSKTALNAVTVAYAKELRDTPVRVNSANPGFTATDLNGHRGHRTPEEAAAVVVRLAAPDPGTPTGTSQDENGTVPW